MIALKDVFEEMPKHFDPQAAGDWTAKIQYRIEGPSGGNFIVSVADKKCEVVEGITEDYTATVLSDTETWVGIAEGTIEPTKAFMSGKIRIFGNMADVMKSQAVFSVEIQAQESTQESFEEDFIALGLFDDKIKLVTMTLDGEYQFIDETHKLHKIFYILSSETMALQEAVEELECLINNKNTKENDLQNFFVRNPEFILNDEYKRAHSHIVLNREKEEALIPDFVLEPIETNPLCDILELKLPSKQVYILKKNRIRFSSAVNEACAQLREYSMYFDEDKNREAVYKRYSLQAYRPKMFVIIGRQGSVNPIDARKAQVDAPQLNIRTYDDVIARMKAKIEAKRI